MITAVMNVPIRILESFTVMTTSSKLGFPNGIATIGMITGSP